MAGEWTISVEGRLRRVTENELAELLESKAISRYARVKQEPAGEWMPAERAVALVRKRRPARASEPAPPPVVSAPARPAGRRVWPWFVGAGAAVVVLLGVGWRSISTTPATLNSEPAIPVAAADREPPHVETAPPADVTRADVPDVPAPPALEPTPPSVDPGPTPTAPPAPVEVASTESSKADAPGTPSADVELPPSVPYGEGTEPISNRPEATDSQVAAFIASVEIERTAGKGSARIEQFIRQYSLSQKQAVQLGDLKRRFSERSKRGLVRLGPKWVTPAEQQAAQDQAKALVRQALALTDLGSAKVAEELLEKASALDGNNIEADLVLGMMKGIVYLPTANPKVAEARYETVLKRSPDHLGALNNAAVVEIRQKHYAEAIDHLARAAELAPRCQEVTQNLGRLSMLAGQGRIAMSAGDRTRCSQIYSRLIAEGKGVAADPKRGYQMMAPYVSPSERSGEPSDSGADLVLVSHGTGFVVAPEMVLTNRHVVTMDDDDRGLADEVRITVERAGGEAAELKGTVKAVSSTSDLALVHFPGLKADPIPLRRTAPLLADEVAILGFPQPKATGADLKFIDGRVGGANSERLLFDCVANQGNSGGPVMSREGDVVGVYNAVQVSGRDVVTRAGMAVPSPEAARFAEQTLGSLAEQKRVPGEWPAIVRRVRGAIFKLDVYCKASDPAILRSLVASAGVSAWFEDPSCPVCSGWGVLSCPGKCIGGDVEEFWTEQATGSVLGRTVIVPQLKKGIRSCGVCDGKGAVECPHCFKGVDPALLP